MPMRSRALSLTLLSGVVAVPLMVSCSSPSEEGTGVGGSSAVGGTTGAGASAGGAAGNGVGGAGGTPSAGAGTVGGTTGVGGSGVAGAGVAGAGVAGAGVAGAGGAAAGSGGAAGNGTAGAGVGGAAGGMSGAAGAGVAGSFVGGGMGGTGGAVMLDCGGKGSAVEAAGPPSNRVNYVIVGDGYSEAQLQAGGTLDEHIEDAMAKRFAEPIGQVYLRYRKFVNICVLRIPSSPICGSSAFGCCGSDSSRLANCNSSSVNNALNQYLPDSFEVDWRAVVLNGSSWWNTGSTLMLWSGGNNDAAGAALHEGGHGFHQLADEYCTRTGSACGANMCSGSGQESNEVNSTGNCQTTGGKWDLWLDYDQTGATGVQGTFIGSRYVDSGQYRPSSNSMMNSLFGNNPNTSFNPVSREKMIMDIWRVVTPIDSTTPPAGAVTNPMSLTVNVIDPAVINVEWSVDGAVIAANGGPTYAIGSAGLSPGTHMVSARAYDNAGMELVRYRSGGNSFGRMNWARSQQTVSWTVTIQ